MDIKSPHFMETVMAAVVLLNLAYFFVYASFLVKKKFKLYPSPVVRPIDPGEPKGINLALIEKETENIVPLNFSAMCDLSVETEPGTSAVARFFVNSRGNISCCASYITTKNIDNAFVEFTTEFEDGSFINTSNHSEPRIFIMDNNELFQYPGASASVLHEIHKNRLDAMEGGKFPKRISEYSEKNFIADNNKLYNRQIACGILRREGDYLRLTVYGAFRAVFIMQMYNFFNYNPRIHKIKTPKASSLPKIIS